MPPSGPTAGSQGAFPFFFLIFMFIYLFGCAGSELKHAGSLAARHVGSSSPTRVRTSAPPPPPHWEHGPPGKSVLLAFLCSLTHCRSRPEVLGAQCASGGPWGQR